jgi:hypothetical protein
MVMSKTSGLAGLFPPKRPPQGGLPLKDTRYHIGPGHPLYDPKHYGDPTNPLPPKVLPPPSTQVMVPGGQTGTAGDWVEQSPTPTVGTPVVGTPDPTVTPIDTPPIPGPGGSIGSIKAKVRVLQMQKKRLMKQIAQIDIQIRNLLGGQGSPIRPPSPPGIPGAPIGPLPPTPIGPLPPTPIGPGLPVPIGPGTPIPQPPPPPWKTDPPWGGNLGGVVPRFQTGGSVPGYSHGGAFPRHGSVTPNPGGGYTTWKRGRTIGDLTRAAGMGGGVRSIMPTRRRGSEHHTLTDRLRLIRDQQGLYPQSAGTPPPWGG